MNSLDMRPYSFRHQQPGEERVEAPAAQFQVREISGRANNLPPCTPDNGILFLNNNIRVKNPMMAKTPPPPMWGDVIEEDLYDYSQPFYDSKKAAEAIFKQRQLEGLPD